MCWLGQGSATCCACSSALPGRCPGGLRPTLTKGVSGKPLFDTFVAFRGPCFRKNLSMERGAGLGRGQVLAWTGDCCMLGLLSQHCQSIAQAGPCPPVPKGLSCKTHFETYMALRPPSFRKEQQALDTGKGCWLTQAGQGGWLGQELGQGSAACDV